MDNLQLKKAAFYPTEIIFFTRKGEVHINVEEIERIEYQKPSVFRYFLAAIEVLLTSITDYVPGQLRIYLKRKVGGRKLYWLRVRFQDVLSILSFFEKKFEIH